MHNGLNSEITINEKNSITPMTNDLDGGWAGFDSIAGSTLSSTKIDPNDKATYIRFFEMLLLMWI